MGRLIDADKLLENQYRIDDSATLSTRDVVDVEDIEDAPTVEAIPKADYENRLKADMVAMLTDIQSEIRHFMYDVNPSSSESDYACNYMIDIIQQKINSLKAESEDNNA